MSIATGGFKCDVCGKMIILMPGQRLLPVTIKGIDRLLHVHNPRPGNFCYFKLKRANEAKDYKLLPYGPLKEMYYQAIREEKANAANVGGNGR